MYCGLLFNADSYACLVLLSGVLSASPGKPGEAHLDPLNEGPDLFLSPSVLGRAAVLRPWKPHGAAVGVCKHWRVEQKIEVAPVRFLAGVYPNSFIQNKQCKSGSAGVLLLAGLLLKIGLPSSVRLPDTTRSEREREKERDFS